MQIVQQTMQQWLAPLVGPWLGPYAGAGAPLLGLDISNASVRLVELAHGVGGAYRVAHYGAERLPRGAVVDGNIENLDQVVDAVRRARQHSGSRARLAALALPPASVISKKIILAADLSAEQLQAQVEAQASVHMPIALEDVRLDYAVIGPVVDAADQIEVLLVAARRASVEDRVAIAEASGLTASVVDIESYATRAVLAQLMAARPSAVAAIFQLGAQVTPMAVLHNGVTVYERELALGGNALTQDIVRAYGISVDEAEMRKQSADLPDSYPTLLLSPFLDRAALEVTRALQFFYTSTPYSHIDQIYLAGAAALLPGLLDTVASSTSIASALLTPFDGMPPSLAPAYLVACGLALRRFGE